MRQDKAASLRERLRKGVSNFEFDALIGGISNVEEEPAAAPDVPAQTAEADRPAAVSTRAASSGESQGLTVALNTLGERLLQESGKLAAALRANDIAESGYYLARVNQVLELLHAVDPAGELARRHSTVAAPPHGQRWPSPVWCLYDFAESPLSGLLPMEANDAFCSAVVATAAMSSEA